MILSDSNIDTKITLETDSNPIDEELPFHVLLLGDWSGRENHPQGSNPVNLHPIEIDRDNFDDVMKKLSVRLDLDFQGYGESGLMLEFTELDDFHPDKIFRKLPLFANLRDTRQKLINKDTFDEAAKEVYSWLTDTKNTEANKVEEPTNSSESNQTKQHNLLEQILGETEENSTVAQKPNSETSELSALIGKLVKPYLIQTDKAEQSKLLTVVDEAISDLMRKLLHHPQFQALESAWRGIHLLVRRVETNAHLKFFLLDVSKSELTNNLKSVTNLNDSDFYRLLVENQQPWSIICGNYTFELVTDDVATLIRLAILGSSAVAPFISHIKPEMFGFDSFSTISDSDKWRINEDSTKSKLWNTLRSFAAMNRSI